MSEGRRGRLGPSAGWGWGRDHHGVPGLRLGIRRMETGRPWPCACALSAPAGRTWPHLPAVGTKGVVPPCRGD